MKFHQRLGTAVALCLLLMLAACGPGVGGTGTGSPAPGVAGLDHFGATPQSACSAPFAAWLACETTGVGGVPVVGAQRTFTSECAVATFEGDDVTLDALCAGWIFVGRWGVDGNGLTRYYGLVGADPMQPPTSPATLEVQPLDDGLIVVLRAADGGLLAGPLLLAPVVSGP